MEVLLQLNISGEETKSGGREEDLEALIAALRRPAVRCRGLMTIPPFEEDPERTRPLPAAAGDRRTVPGHWLAPG